MKRENVVHVVEMAIVVGAILLFKFLVLSMTTMPTQHFPIECASTCSPHPMQSFDPSTGKCVCAP